MDLLHMLSEATPDLVRHCVGSYMAKNPGSDTGKAFAICVSTMQKAGYVKPGTIELTGAGKSKEKEHESEPDAAKKKARYEKFLAQAREEAALVDSSLNISETATTIEHKLADVDRLLAEAKKQVGPGRPSLPIGAVRRWEKEGKKVAMVKVGEPSIWIHKKERQSGTVPVKGHWLPKGTVRQWKRRTVVKVGDRRWVSHKAKYSQEGAEQPSQPSLQESRHTSLKARLLSKSEPIGVTEMTNQPGCEKQACMGAGKGTNRRLRLRARVGEMRHPAETYQSR